jgi:hypothetical protein
LPGLASNHDLPNLSLPNRKDYRDKSVVRSSELWNVILADNSNSEQVMLQPEKENIFLQQVIGKERRKVFVRPTKVDFTTLEIYSLTQSCNLKQTGPGEGVFYTSLLSIRYQDAILNRVLPSDLSGESRSPGISKSQQPLLFTESMPSTHSTPQILIQVHRHRSAMRWEVQSA